MSTQSRKESRWLGGAVLGFVAIVALVLFLRSPSAAEGAKPLPPPAHDPVQSGVQVAILAGGCFWGVEGVYERVRGVRRVLSGYAGGDANTAVYDRVAGGDTDHAEAVRIEFDAADISYGEILQIFFSVAHDPTQLNRQGPDEGPQYRSAIFYGDAVQKEVAERYIAQLDAAKVFKRSIVTRLDALKEFFPAEDYHQDFMVKNPSHPYIVFHDVPKVEALAEIFKERYRAPSAR